MKKVILALFLGATAFCAAQDSENTENDSTDRKHEIRIDVLEALAVPTAEINYEYVISKYSGVGAAVSVNLSSDDFDDYQTFAITPYYRQYFFNKKDYGARGLFAEGLLQFAGGEEEQGFFDENTNLFVSTTRDWTQFGVGFALGQKWVSRNGFVLEISIGGGRYFGGEDFAPEAFARGGVLVGYRF